MLAPADTGVTVIDNATLLDLSQPEPAPDGNWNVKNPPAAALFAPIAVIEIDLFVDAKSLLELSGMTSVGISVARLS